MLGQDEKVRTCRILAWHIEVGQEIDDEVLAMDVLPDKLVEFTATSDGGGRQDVMQVKL
jgi:hypothetical protein